jgi:hypothetical protein
MTRHSLLIKRTALMLLGLGCACSGQPMPAAGDASAGTDAQPQCPNDLPASCPASMPSYQTDIAPLLQNRCVPCHNPSGIESAKPLNSYSAVYGLRSTVLTQVYGCQMPPTGAQPLDAAERQELLTWLVCQAPNN